MTRETTRDQIVQAADELFYQQGFAQTSFADIASAVRISRGNFYYHFKTKDEILAAVIDLRLTRTRRMLTEWGAESDSPRTRIERFIDILVMNGSKISRFGCPVGSLASELSKLDHVAQGDANRLFTLFRDWLEKQFTALGRGDDARALSMQLLSRSQGAAVLAQSFGDIDFLHSEAAQMRNWLAHQLEENGACS